VIDQNAVTAPSDRRAIPAFSSDFTFWHESTDLLEVGFEQVMHETAAIEAEVASDNGRHAGIIAGLRALSFSSASVSCTIVPKLARERRTDFCPGTWQDEGTANS
jgi:hypothetical protein